MYPTITIGNVKIASYALCTFAGIVACCVYILVVLLRIEKADKNTVLKTFAVFVPSLVVLYLSAVLFDALFHSIQEGKLVTNGITWEGGVIGGFTAYIVFTHFFFREKKGSELDFFSLLVPGIVLGHAFGRVGCFLGGCCYGKISFVGGVVFPDGSPADLQYPNNFVGSVPVLPTQLYEAGFELLLFAVMLILYKKYRTLNLEIYCLAYGAFRFGLEFFRGDNRGATGLFISPSQLMSIILITAGILIILFKRGIIFKKLAAKAEVWRREATLPMKITDSEDVYACIERLQELRDGGALTEEEFTQKKNDLLGRL